MPLNILGMIGVAPASSSSTVHIIGGGVDPQYIARFAQVHEAAGFDAVLVGYSSSSADGFAVTQHAAQHTERLNFLLAHRPGFVAPTLTARKVATLDQLIGGRLWLHIITGGSDAEQQRDGDYLTHDERYARTDEYLTVLRRCFAATEPFSFEGQHYRFTKAFSEIKAAQTPNVPLWIGGISPAAQVVGTKHCDTYALFGEPLAAIKELIDSLQGQAAVHNRRLRFNLSFRPIIAASEGAAWDKARKILAGVQAAAKQHRIITPEAETSRRLLRLVEGGDVQDERLWVPIAAAAGGSGNSTALVGTPDQVADAIARYVDLGISGVLIRGFDPYDDAIAYGEALIPAIRARVAERDAVGVAPASEHS